MVEMYQCITRFQLELLDNFTMNKNKGLTSLFSSQSAMCKAVTKIYAISQHFYVKM